MRQALKTDVLKRVFLYEVYEDITSFGKNPEDSFSIYHASVNTWLAQFSMPLRQRSWDVKTNIFITIEWHAAENGSININTELFSVIVTDFIHADYSLTVPGLASLIFDSILNLEAWRLMSQLQPEVQTV